MAESVIGLYKAEVIRHEGPWKSLDDVEFATLEWVDWFNHTYGCLSRSATSHRPSSKRAYYADSVATKEEERLKQESLH